jgi:cGMP-dependent protein kinase
MGGAASTLNVDKSQAEKPSLNEQGPEAEIPPSPAPGIADRKPRRHRIFEKATASEDVPLMPLPRHTVDDATRQLLIEAFTGFYFLQSEPGDKTRKMEQVIQSMEKESFEVDQRLITEGESGDRLYVVESGDLEVTINGEVIRKMSKGTMVGELALLYDAPRSATVRCVTAVVVWSLRREHFKRIQAASASEAYNERARWLINCPELAVLSALDLSRLVGTLKMHQYLEGDYLYSENELTNECVLIEKGNAAVYMASDPKNMKDSALDDMLSITRPRGGSNSIINSNAKIVKKPSAKTESKKIGDSSNQTDVPDGYFISEVSEGCLLGVGILRGKAQMNDSWRWVSEEEMVSLGYPSKSKDAAVAPCSVVAACDMQCLTFTVDVFENLFGPVSKVLQPKVASLERTRSTIRASDSVISAQMASLERKFDSWKFKIKHVLGSGTFGIVSLAEYRENPTAQPLHVALKSLSKATVIETGQLRHVIDERKLLSIMNSRFILKLYGTYQTPHQLVMVTEALSGGDLWGVIYETQPFASQKCLPLELLRFYATTILLALAHVHKKGIAYRDLKPENVMLDDKGYLRLIDFGFAKKVPYTKVDPTTGEEKVYAKTQTLCGTPEYLSPELIFNLGHDQSADVWAFGCIVHEMEVSITPFAPKRPDNITELFTNIGMVKRHGLKLNQKVIDRDPPAASLVEALLVAEPSE